MRRPSPSQSKAARADILSQYPVRDTPPDVTLDDLTALAAHICQTPMALLVFVDEQRLWFKSRLGFATPDDAPDISFCWHAVQQRDLFVVPDAAGDARFSADGFVTGEPRVRFYAGAPLETPEGQILGVLCVMDRSPRELRPAQEQALRTLARQVMTHLELVRRTRELSEARDDHHRQLARLHQTQFTLDHATDSVHWVSSDGRLVYVNDVMCRTLGYSKEELLSLTVFDIDPNFSREAWPDYWRKTRERGKIVFQTEHRTKAGGAFPVEVASTCIRYGEEDFSCACARDITDRHRTEMALRETEFFLNKSQQVAQIGSYKFEVATGAWIGSSSLDAIFGIDDRFPRTVDGWLDLVAPEQREEMRRHLLDQVVVGCHRFEREYRIIRQTDGQERWVFGLGELEFDPQGRPLRMIGTIQDITDRKRSERALRMFQFSADQAADAVFWMDRQAGFYYVNDQACRSLGYTREELMGLRLFDIDPTYPRESWEAAWRDFHDRRIQTQHLETWHRRQDGTLFPVEISARQCWFDDTDLHVAFARDITQRRQAEEHLRQSQAELDATYTHAPIILCLLDSQLQVHRLNRAGLEFACLAVADPTGLPTCRLLGCRDAHGESTMMGSAPACEACPLRQTLTRTLTTGRSHQRVEITKLLLRGGATREVTLLASTALIPLGKESLVLLCLEDITDHRRAEKAQARLETQLRQAQKMEAIGTLAGGIAHDFNNILGAIIGNADLARMDMAADHPAQESLSEISKAARRAGDLVRQILSFSRLQKPRREIVQLQPVIKEALKLLRAAIPSTVEIQSELEAEGPTVLADPTQVHQVTMNLCTNAYHALPQRDGRLTVKFGVIDVDDVLASQHAELRVGRYLRLSVTDNGHGMDRPVLDRIFEPFFTTKVAGQGTGLGLSVVHGIVKSHEGAITVYSAPGQGTTFHVYFPASAEETLPEATPAAVIPRGQGERILFLDDEEPLARTAKRVLERLGYRVIALTDPVETLERFRADPTHFDLVITDLSMPGMNGLDLARELLTLRPTQAILLSTGFSGAMTPEGLRERGLRDLLWKPVTARSLGETVFRALHPEPGHKP